MSVVKLKAAQKQLEAAAKNGIKVLNDVTKGAFAHSPAATEPLEYAGWITQTLKAGITELETTARFAGLDEAGIESLLAQERADERTRLQAEASAALKAYAAKPQVVTADDEPEESDPIGQLNTGDDQTGTPDDNKPNDEE